MEHSFLSIRPVNKVIRVGRVRCISSGLSLNFHFDRDGRTRHPFQAWTGLPRIVGSVLY
jgi:hypothetical protein